MCLVDKSAAVAPWHVDAPEGYRVEEKKPPT